MSLVFIDDFKNKHNGIHILTHAHTDHLRSIPKTFDQIIYCSPKTKELLPNIEILDDRLIPGTWVEIDDLKFYVFDSNHCMGSIGLYWDHNLYWGDGRPYRYPMFRHLTIKTIHQDSFWQDCKVSSLPGPHQTREWIRSLLHMDGFNYFVIVLPHFALLEHLPREFCYHLKVKDGLPDQLCQRAFDLLQLPRCEKTNIFLTRNKSKPKSDVLYIHPTSRWWRDRTEFEPVFETKNEVRVFFSNHASKEENHWLMDLLQ